MSPTTSKYTIIEEILETTFSYVVSVNAIYRRRKGNVKKLSFAAELCSNTQKQKQPKLPSGAQISKPTVGEMSALPSIGAQPTRRKSVRSGS
jgi:hypothetical protein